MAIDCTLPLANCGLVVVAAVVAANVVCCVPVWSWWPTSIARFSAPIVFIETISLAKMHGKSSMTSARLRVVVVVVVAVAPPGQLAPPNAVGLHYGNALGWVTAVERQPVVVAAVAVATHSDGGHRSSPNTGRNLLAIAVLALACLHRPLALHRRLVGKHASWKTLASCTPPHPPTRNPQV